jgi:hypothetical protein
MMFSIQDEKNSLEEEAGKFRTIKDLLGLG